VLEKVVVDNDANPLKEATGGVLYPVVSQVDLGTGANQIPTCGMLGQVAFLDRPIEIEAVAPSYGQPISKNSRILFELTSNTQLTIRVRGNDGVVRSANITLA